MSVASEVNKIQYTADGTVGPYTYPFPIDNAGDLQVIDTALATGLETVKVLTTDYAVSGVGNPAGGTITFVSGHESANGNRLTLVRNVALTQGLDLIQSGDLPSASLEKALDKLTFIAQQNDEATSRAVKVPRTSLLSDVEIPDPSLAINYGKFYRAKADGTGVESVTINTGAEPSLLNAKGDLLGHTGAAPGRAAVGANDTILQADATQSFGWVWRTLGAALLKLLTTKGDLATSTGSTVQRRAVGADNTVLRANSANADGVEWGDVTATQSDLDAGTVTNKYLNPAVNRITLGTPQASTSGTAIDFTGIPAGTRRVHIHFVGVSLSGTDATLIQIGDSGGIETTGYSGAGVRLVNTIAVIGAGGTTTGFNILTGVATTALYGTATLYLVDPSTNQWTLTGVFGYPGGDTVYATGGAKSLSATLDRVRITPSGANTFDAGSINISYER